MTASFPTSTKSFTAVTDGVDYPEAVDINSLQEEVVAVETYLRTSGTSASLATNATETIIAAGTTAAVYFVNIVSDGSGNTAWSGAWLVFVSGNITITKVAAGGGQSDLVASGTNIQVKNLNATSVTLKWAYSKQY